MEQERRYTRIGDARVHSVHAGAGAPVMLLHGLAGSHHWWRYTVPALARRFGVHVPELVGFGRSRPAGTPPSPADAAALLVAWLDRIGAERAHVVGHSMGGQIAIHLAARWPERVQRLVLTGAAGIPRRLSLRELGRLAAELVPPRAWGRAAFLPTIVLDAWRAGPATLWTAMRHVLGDDVRPLLPAVRSRTLLIWGELDPLIPLEHGRIMEAAIPESELLVLPAAAHNPMADRPGPYNAAVLAFLGGR